MPTHVISFRFVPREPSQVTKITSIHKLTSGVFNISGTLKWNGEAHIPSEKTTQMVRDSTFTDSTGSMPLSVGKFYAITNCRLRHFYGKCLATTKLTVVSTAEAQDITKAVEQRKDNLLCCPDILNVHVDSFLACNSKDCKKRVNATPGSKIVKCNNCSRSMLIKNCYVDMTVHFDLEKDHKSYSVTAFPKALSAFLQKDVIAFKDDTDTLTADLLVLENIEFHLSQNGKLITKMSSHTTTGSL